MPVPRTDDFRLERDGDRLLVTFTPTGRRYAFGLDGNALSDPEEVRAPVSQTGDYAEEEVRRAAADLASLALTGSAERG